MYPVEQKPPPRGPQGPCDNDVDACILCGICAKRCPCDAIAVDKPARTWSIDRFRCVQCGTLRARVPEALPDHGAHVHAARHGKKSLPDVVRASPEPGRRRCRPRTVLTRSVKVRGCRRDEACCQELLRISPLVGDGASSPSSVEGPRVLGRGQSAAGRPAGDEDDGRRRSSRDRGTRSRAGDERPHLHRAEHHLVRPAVPRARLPRAAASTASTSRPRFLFALAAGTDWIDGQIARRTHAVSKLGQLLDPAVDRILMISGRRCGLFLVGRLPLVDHPRRAAARPASCSWAARCCSSATACAWPSSIRARWPRRSCSSASPGCC